MKYYFASRTLEGRPGSNIDILHSGLWHGWNTCDFPRFRMAQNAQSGPCRFKGPFLFMPTELARRVAKVADVRVENIEIVLPYAWDVKPTLEFSKFCKEYRGDHRATKLITQWAERFPYSGPMDLVLVHANAEAELGGDDGIPIVTNGSAVVAYAVKLDKAMLAKHGMARHAGVVMSEPVFEVLRDALDFPDFIHVQELIE